MSKASEDYVCPICLGLEGSASDKTLICQSDIVYKDKLVTVLINSFFLGKNAGHVIVVPNEHYENIYDIPVKYGRRIFDLSKAMALVIKKAYRCDGIKIMQNNEPAADQHAFHYHLHVFPRYNGDNFNGLKPEDKRLADPDERSRYADKLRQHLQFD